MKKTFVMRCTICQYSWRSIYRLLPPTRCPNESPLRGRCPGKGDQLRVISE